MLITKLANKTLPTALLLVAVALVATPIMTIAITAASGSFEVIASLAHSVLPRYISTTIWILLGTGVGCLFWGVACAAIVTWYQFPARRIFCWALALPLAIPAYVTGFVYTQFAENPLVVALGIEIRSGFGLVLLFSFALFPYVFLLTIASLNRQSQRIFEAGRMLGFSPRKNLLRIALPSARPAIAAGCTLAMLEALNDFGTVQMFALETISTAIYEVWWLYSDKAAAAQIALITLLFVIALLLGERATRRKQGYEQVGYSQAVYAQTTQQLENKIQRLKGGKAVIAFCFCLTPLAIGFIIPCLFLIYETIYSQIHDWSQAVRIWKSYTTSAANSLLVAGAAAIATTALGFAVVLLCRNTERKGEKISAKNRALLMLAGSGYAMPGTMLAMGTLIFVLYLQKVMPLKESLLLNSALMLVFVYMARFLTIALSGAESAATRLTSSITDAAKVIGMTHLKIIRRIHLPLLRGDLIAVALIVFIDGTKELSATFLLRSFDFDTLATQVYEFMREEQFAKAAPGALMITMLGIAAIILLASWAQKRSSTTRLRLFR